MLLRQHASFFCQTLNIKTHETTEQILFERERNANQMV